MRCPLEAFDTKLVYDKDKRESRSKRERKEIIKENKEREDRGWERMI